MRITVDLPDDLHRRITTLATHTRRSIGQTAIDLMRRGLAIQARAASAASTIQVDSNTGLPVLHGGRTVLPEDVKAIEDAS